jgi:hypothetical protein
MPGTGHADMSCIKLSIPSGGEPEFVFAFVLGRNFLRWLHWLPDLRVEGSKSHVRDRTSEPVAAD